jgi:hypothetical protein
MPPTERDQQDTKCVQPSIYIFTSWLGFSGPTGPNQTEGPTSIQFNVTSAINLKKRLEEGAFGDIGNIHIDSSDSASCPLLFVIIPESE